LDDWELENLDLDDILLDLLNGDCGYDWYGAIGLAKWDPTRWGIFDVLPSVPGGPAAPAPNGRLKWTGYASMKGGGALIFNYVSIEIEAWARDASGKLITFSGSGTSTELNNGGLQVGYFEASLNFKDMEMDDDFMNRGDEVGVAFLGMGGAIGVKASLGVSLWVFPRQGKTKYGGFNASGGFNAFLGGAKFGVKLDKAEIE
jgi:hypothetical protein